MNRKLSSIIKNMAAENVCNRRDCSITGLTYDSRQVRPGDIFFAFEGLHTNGHLYINKAIEKGAVTIVHSEELADYRENIVYIRVSDTRKTLSKAAATFYNFPSDDLTVIGVTGTDGKSSTVWFIHQLLELLRINAGLISSVFIKAKDTFEKNPFRQSTPEASEIHHFLHEIKKSGKEAVVLEATSHGLSHKTSRLLDVSFNVGVLTNVSHEHLEFHGRWEQYRDDKANLFRQISQGKKQGTGRSFGVVNTDDPSSIHFTRATDCPVYSYSLKSKEADLAACNLAEVKDGMEFDLLLKNSEKFRAFLPLMGGFNVSNILAAILTVSRLYDISIKEIVSLLTNIKGVHGRMEQIEMGQPFQVVVDYAHTPGSFKVVLPYFKKRTRGRLITVFGSAGERDTAKRPMQGEIACRYADIIILTDEDPRQEDRIKILEDIAAGCPGKVKGENLFLEPDRRRAIRQAITMAHAGDTVLCLGKGHEQSIIYADGPVKWDEIEVIRDILKQALKS
jgi:UDP-N-acetylmuramoyl-L-alanyl-D-glutamate--2,6-diaminopimelate ligase